LELLRKDLLLGCVALMSYDNYLVAGYSMGLGRLLTYDRFDLELMAILGILKKRGPD